MVNGKGTLAGWGSTVHQCTTISSKMEIRPINATPEIRASRGAIQHGKTQAMHLRDMCGGVAPTENDKSDVENSIGELSFSMVFDNY